MYLPEIAGFMQNILTEAIFTYDPDLLLILTKPLSYCGKLEQFLNLSESQFPYLEKNSFFVGSLKGQREIKFVKLLAFSRTSPSIPDSSKWLQGKVAPHSPSLQLSLG